MLFSWRHVSHCFGVKLNFEWNYFLELVRIVPLLKLILFRRGKLRNNLYLVPYGWKREKMLPNWQNRLAVLKRILGFWKLSKWVEILELWRGALAGAFWWPEEWFAKAAASVMQVEGWKVSPGRVKNMSFCMFFVFNDCWLSRPAVFSYFLLFLYGCVYVHIYV